MQLKRLLTQITKFFVGAFIVAYPFMVFYALQQNVAVKFIGLVLLMVVLLSFAKNKNKYIFMSGLVLCLLIICFNQEIFLRLYPVIMNAAVCTIFALSLKKTPLVTQFAQKMHKEPLDKQKLIYTRHVTQAWAIFMFVNMLVSFATVFMSIKIWTLYNGFISYVLIGTMILSEYVIRKGKEKCSIQ